VSELPNIPSDQEIHEVDRYRCSVNGHSPTMIGEMGKEWPVALTCSRCGESAQVVP